MARGVPVVKSERHGEKSLLDPGVETPVLSPEWATLHLKTSGQYKGKKQ